MSAARTLVVRTRLVLDRFALDVEFETRHLVTGVFGASGSGKSSLLESIAGLRRRATGLVRLGDETWLDSSAGLRLPPEARHVGYVPQDGLLFPHLDVRGNLLAGAPRARREGHPVDSTLRSVCDVLELGALLERNVATLSGGERQRVALGRALCSGPRLLLLDEPLASLDLALRRRVLPFLRRVRSEFSVPMLLVSHDPTEVQALCDELVVLRDGSVIARGAPRDVLCDPAVFPLAREEGFENVLPCTPEDHDGDTSRVTLGGDGIGKARGGVSLVTPRVKGHPGDAMLVSIPSREIMVATREPRGISAQNVLAARIVGVEAAGDARLVVASVGSDVPSLIAELTARACEQLALHPGQEIYLVIKASGCFVYETGAA